MLDSRFFESLGPISLADLATLTGSQLPNASAAGRPVAGVSVLGRAQGDEVSFFADKKHLGLLQSSAAGFCFVRADDVASLPRGCEALVNPAPQAAWATAALSLHRPRLAEAGAAQVHPTANLEEGVKLGHGAAVAQGVQIGSGAVIGPGAAIGPGVAIGRDCVIGPNAVIGFALLGDRVSVYAGAVIGEAGFGLAVGPRGLIDVPQLGRVILQDGVVVGANTCIDRGAFDDTVIGENSKIDNLVQIGHNCQIGRNCVIAGQCGISGTTVLGDGVQMGGRAATPDHITLGPGARLAAGAATMRDIPAGETWAGVPAMPIRQFMRQVAWVTRGASGKTSRGDQ
ncbi:MAG: UDP-3-O-(3-hydroxymyristoyl)glucosamine N-acyltransferase [Caulobacterales bacterium]